MFLWIQILRRSNNRFNEFSGFHGNIVLNHDTANLSDRHDIPFVKYMY